MALLGLLGDTKETKPSLNPPTTPLHSVSRATGQSCSSQIIVQHAFKGLRVNTTPVLDPQLDMEPWFLSLGEDSGGQISSVPA